MENRTCNECGDVFNDPEQLRRHLRKHGMTFQQYSLTWTYKNSVPLCKCGCGKQTSWNVASKGYAEFVLGHHANGRKKSDEEKRKIGAKNSINMKKYMEDHPDVAKERQSLMTLAGMNSKTSLKKSIAMNRFWSSDSELTKQRRKEASDRAIILLEQNKIGPQAPFKTCYITNPFTGKEEYMHSSWETAFLMKCYKEQYPVTKIHDIRIPYVAIDGTDHVYVPDFVSLVESVVFEVKGLIRENDEAKFLALQKWASVNGYEAVMVQIAP